jgi:nucleoside-diphosphate-sugar epimerase
VSAPVLVTGATGGLGRVLVPALLAQGRQVIATGRDRVRGGELARLGAAFVPADLAKDPVRPLVEGVQTVFHLAARSSPWGPPDAFVSANVAVTRRLLDAARNAGCARFVFTSTPSIYTRARRQIGLTEAAPPPRRPVNAYARTKLAAERLVVSAGRPGFATVTIRPRAIVSPYDTVLLPRLLSAAKRGRMPLPGHGRALIEPTDARDVCSALLAAESRCEALSGQVFNVSGGQPISLARLAGYVFDRLGMRIRLIPLPAHLVLGMAHLAEAAARLNPGADEPAVTVYSAMALGWSQTFDLSAARQKLGWAPAVAPCDAIDWALEGRAHA